MNMEKLEHLTLPLDPIFDLDPKTSSKLLKILGTKPNINLHINFRLDFDSLYHGRDQESYHNFLLNLMDFNQRIKHLKGIKIKYLILLYNLDDECLKKLIKDIITNKNLNLMIDFEYD